MPICPSCGSSNFIPIVYGKPSQEAIEKEKRGEIVLGGCIVSPDDNKFRFLVKFNENNILKIGRSLEMQLILNDISVSRNHCHLIINDDGDVILEDNSSRFGSLVLIQDEIEILKGHKLHVQAGSNYLTFTLDKKKGLFSCCNAEEIDNKNTYEKLNSLSIKYNKNNGIMDESFSIENKGFPVLLIEKPPNLSNDLLLSKCI